MTTKPVPPVHQEEQERLDKIVEIKAKMEEANEKRITHYNSFWHRIRGMSRSRASYDLNCEMGRLRDTLDHLEEWKIVTDRAFKPKGKVLQHTRNGMLLHLITRPTGSTQYHLQSPRAASTCERGGCLTFDFSSPEYPTPDQAEFVGRCMAQQVAYLTDLSKWGDE